jgi:hypothetical protein
MSQISPELANASVIDEQKNPHVLKDEWREKTAVVAWVRHFG